MDNIDIEITNAMKNKRALEYKTKLDKIKFISEIKNGLGDTIKKDPLRVKFIKPSWFVRVFITLKKIITTIFTKF